MLHLVGDAQSTRALVRPQSCLPAAATSSAASGLIATAGDA